MRVLILLASTLAFAQPAADSFVARAMMAFDKKNDGKFDARRKSRTSACLNLFDRADANKDGIVTKEELVALFAAEQVSRWDEAEEVRAWVRRQSRHRSFRLSCAIN